MPVIITPSALKQMKAMPKADATRMLAALEQVAADLTTRLPFVTEMVGQPGIWRLRKGDWRAVYVIEGVNIVVIKVGNRKEIYQ